MNWFWTWLRFAISEFLELGNGLSEVEIDAYEKVAFVKSFCCVIFVVAVFGGYKGKERKTRGAVPFTYETIYFKRGPQNNSFTRRIRSHKS